MFAITNDIQNAWLKSFIQTWLYTISMHYTVTSLKKPYHKSMSICNKSFLAMIRTPLKRTTRFYCSSIIRQNGFDSICNRSRDSIENFIILKYSCRNRTKIDCWPFSRHTTDNKDYRMQDLGSWLSKRMEANGNAERCMWYSGFSFLETWNGQQYLQENFGNREIFTLENFFEIKKDKIVWYELR